MPKVSVRQIKAARVLIGWSQDVLAERSGVSVPTIKRLESEEGELGGRAETVEKIIAALNGAGVIFLEENGEGHGVRLKKNPPGIAEITEKIHALNEQISAFPVDGPPSPNIGMNRLKKALVENEKAKLKNRRAKLKKSEAEMTETAKEFLEDWRQANIYAQARAIEELDSVFAECVADAKRIGLTEDALQKASGGLRAFLRAAIENAA